MKKIAVLQSNYIPWKGYFDIINMVDEFILYDEGKVIGGIFDDRFLVKPTPAAMALMPDASREIPYPGGKEMLLVDNVDDRSFLEALLPAMVEELPETKKKSSSRKRSQLK